MGPNTRNTGTEFQEQVDRLFRGEPEEEPASEPQDADKDSDKTNEE